MSANYKWFNNDTDKELSYVVVFMVSRNKDNKDVPNFKERKQAFLSTKDLQKIKRKFTHFVEDGVKGEMSRLYISVNARDTSKIKKELLHTLIDKDEIQFEHIQGMVAGIAARKENAAEKKWMFDFDSLDTKKLIEFLEDLMKYGFGSDEVKFQSTPHGYAIIVSHGFDTRNLLEKWKDIVTLKRDDLICEDWRIK